MKMKRELLHSLISAWRYKRYLQTQKDAAASLTKSLARTTLKSSDKHVPQGNGASVKAIKENSP